MKKVVITAAVILVLTAGAFAQRGPRAQGGTPSDTPGQRHDPATALKAALNLTDAQVSAIQAILQNARTQAQTIMSDLKQKHQTLNALLDAASPNPTDIGNAALAVRAGEKQLKALHDTVLANIKSQLTTDQQAILETLLKAGVPLPGLGGFGFGGPGPRGLRGPRRGQ